MTLDRKMILISYYIESIKRAKKLGYYCIIYTNKECFKYFEDLVDEILLIENYESILFDGIKAHIMGLRDDEFCLIDGDLILNKKLPDFKTDVVFDTYEIQNWEDVYQPVINQLDKLGIGNHINIWDTQKIPVINTGILFIKNIKIRKEWFTFFNIFNNFIKNLNDEHKIETHYAALVGGQYLLTLLLNKTSEVRGEFFNNNNEFYRHYATKGKYYNPPFSYKHLISEELKSIKKNIL